MLLQELCIQKLLIGRQPGTGRAGGLSPRPADPQQKKKADATHLPSTSTQVSLV